MTCGCLAPEYTEPQPPGVTSSAGSTIAYEAANGRVWLTSPDDDRVVALDAESLQQVLTYDVTDEPSHLAILNGALIVTATHDSRVWLLPPASEQPLTIETPCGATRGVAWLDAAATRALVSCPWDDRLRRRLRRLRCARQTHRRRRHAGNCPRHILGRRGRVQRSCQRLLRCRNHQSSSDRLAGTTSATRTRSTGHTAGRAYCFQPGCQWRHADCRQRQRPHASSRGRRLWAGRRWKPPHRTVYCG